MFLVLRGLWKYWGGWVGRYRFARWWVEYRQATYHKLLGIEFRFIKLYVSLEMPAQFCSFSVPDLDTKSIATLSYTANVILISARMKHRRHIFHEVPTLTAFKIRMLLPHKR
jgi:hypothetical protein